MRFWRFFFLSRPLLLYLLYFLSSDELDSLDDDSEDDGSDSRSSGTCAFPLRFYEYVSPVSGLGYVMFVPIVVESKCDVVTFIVFVTIGVDSKGG